MKWTVVGKHPRPPTRKPRHFEEPLRKKNKPPKKEPISIEALRHHSSQRATGATQRSAAVPGREPDGLE